MKKLTTLFLVAFFGIATLNAQIANPSFEFWTDYGDYEEPDNWNTPNPYTNDAQFGLSETTVTKDSVHFNTGPYSARLETIEINIQGLFTLGAPGVVTNGEINLDAADILGGTIDFSELIVGGTPATDRFDKFTGYFTYVPAGIDQAAFLAFMKKDGEVIGSAVYFHGATQTTFTQFEADFVYTSCATPDTLLIIALSSADENGVDGSLLHVDDLDVSGVNTNTLPEANSALLTTVVDSAITFELSDYTFDCDGDNLTITNTTDPANGTLTESGGEYTYTPNAGYSGEDSFTYTVCDDGTPELCNTGTVTINVETGVGIFNRVEENSLLAVYPNPANHVITFELKNVELTNASIQITDITGRLVNTVNITGTHTSVSVTEMVNGVYVYQFIDNDGNILSNGRFAISN